MTQPTTTVEVHDDLRDRISVLQIPKPLWLFAELLFRSCGVDPREDDPAEVHPVVGSCHIYHDKLVMRYHGGDPEVAREWCDLLTEEEEEEEDSQW